GSTVVASKLGVLKRATAITPLLLGLIVLGDSPGLISRVTSRAAGVALNSKEPMSQSAPGMLSPSAGRRKPRWSVEGGGQPEATASMAGRPETRGGVQG